MSTRVASYAAVLLAATMREGDDATVQWMVDEARVAGADPVVVVVPRGQSSPTQARAVQVAAGATRISAIRAGMAVLANTSVGHALLWPFDPMDGKASEAVPLVALVDDAMRTGAAVTALAGADLDRAPVLVARDAWLEVMTLGEQGLSVVAARRGLRSVPG